MAGMDRLMSHTFATAFDLGRYEGQPYMIDQLMLSGDVEGD